MVLNLLLLYITQIKLALAYYIHIGATIKSFYNKEHLFVDCTSKSVVTRYSIQTYKILQYYAIFTESAFSGPIQSLSRYVCSMAVGASDR